MCTARNGYPSQHSAGGIDPEVGIDECGIRSPFFVVSEGGEKSAQGLHVCLLRIHDSAQESEREIFPEFLTPHQALPFRRMRSFNQPYKWQFPAEHSLQMQMIGG